MCCTKVILAAVRGPTGVGESWKRSQEVWEYRVPGEGLHRERGLSEGLVRPPLR